MRIEKPASCNEFALFYRRRITIKEKEKEGEKTLERRGMQDKEKGKRTRWPASRACPLFFSWAEVVRARVNKMEPG